MSYGTRELSQIPLVFLEALSVNEATGTQEPLVIRTCDFCDSLHSSSC